MAIVKVLGNLTGKLMSTREASNSLDLSRQYFNSLVASGLLTPVLEIEDYGKVQMRIFSKTDIDVFKKKREQSR